MDDILIAAKDCWIRVRRHGRSQYLAGKRADRMHNWLGVPVVILTTVVGTTIFSTLSSNPELMWKIATGLLSLGAAVISALQTFFNFYERAVKHRQAGANYGGLQRNLEIFLLTYKNGSSQVRAQAIKELALVTNEIAQLEKESPDVPDNLYDRAIREQQSDKEQLWDTMCKEKSPGIA